MKRLMVLTLAGVLGLAPLLLGQAPKASEPETKGRGRGGAPHAWCDQDKDGKCGLSGNPVGQGQDQGCGRGGMRAGRRGWVGQMAMGRGMSGGMRPGRGRGFATRQAGPPAVK